MSIKTEIKTAAGDLFNRMQIASYSSEFMQAVVDDLQTKVNAKKNGEPAAFVAMMEGKKSKPEPKTQFADNDIQLLREAAALRADRIRNAAAIEQKAEMKIVEYTNLLEDAPWEVTPHLKSARALMVTRAEEAKMWIKIATAELNEIFEEMSRRVK